MATVRDRTASAVADAVSAAVAALLNCLDADQRTAACFEFADLSERTNWAYFPRNHSGLPLLAMTPAQQKLAHVLVSSALSLHAYGKATTIMGLESVLNLLESRRANAVRDPGRYFVSVFGVPGDDRWGWRLEGHHVCLNFTLAGGEIVSSTPIFLGANPAEVRHGDTAIIRACGEEEDAARELLASLDADQRRAAIICTVAPPDFVLMNIPQVPATILPGEAGALPQVQVRFDAMLQEHREALRFDRSQPRGLPASAMNGGQRKLLSDLINVYVERLPDPLADFERSKVEHDLVCFAWAGDETPRQPHYYRLQAPSFIVEYDNTQDDANHVHAVWRNPERDFSGDLLRSHLASGH